MLVLGIESSCDETAAAVHDSSRGLLGSVVSSQVDVHRVYGGVVPELASREHVRSVQAVVEQALAEAAVLAGDLDGVAVTAGPGLIGSLLVGLCFGKSLAWALGIPVTGVDHLEAHVFASLLEEEIPFPYVSLLVSGGHTSLFRVTGWGEVEHLGGTRDDAAGEAFDKAAKMLGLPYPGGVSIDNLSREGDPDKVRFPRPRLPGTRDFSFSGLKTALRTFLASPEGSHASTADVAASFQEAVASVLAEKAVATAVEEGIPRLVLAGGVAANSRLRDLASSIGERAGVRVHLPAKWLCTDNAAMVALLGSHRIAAGLVDGPELNAYASARFHSR